MFFYILLCFKKSWCRCNVVKKSIKKNKNKKQLHLLECVSSTTSLFQWNLLSQVSWSENTSNCENSIKKKMQKTAPVLQAMDIFKEVKFLKKLWCCVEGEGGRGKMVR